MIISWFISHIFKKVFKRRPPFTHFYASTWIVFVFAFIVTPPMHRLPWRILWSVAWSMLCHSFFYFSWFFTPTSSGLARAKVGKIYRSDLPTGTFTYKHTLFTLVFRFWYYYPWTKKCHHCRLLFYSCRVFLQTFFKSQYVIDTDKSVAISTSVHWKIIWGRQDSTDRSRSGRAKGWCGRPSKNTRDNENADDHVDYTAVAMAAWAIRLLDAAVNNPRVEPE